MKVLAAVLFLAMMAVGGYAIHLSQQVAAATQQVADLQAQLQEREAALSVETATRVPEVKEVAQAPVVDARAASATAEPISAQSQAASDEGETFVSMLMAQQSSPEARARLRASMRASLATTLPDIGEAVGLSLEEESRLLDLLAKHQDFTGLMFSGDGSSNTPATRAERAAAYEERQRTQDAELRAMLGSNYERYKDYRETLPVWRQRSDLRAVLDAAGVPLTDAQGRSLIAALSVEQRSFNQQTRAAASQGETFPQVLLAQISPERRQRLLNVAAAYLNPQQLDGYKGMLERAAAGK